MNASREFRDFDRHVANEKTDRQAAVIENLIEVCEQMLHCCDPDQDEAFDWVREVLAEAKAIGE